MEKRKNFYANEMNYDRMEEQLKETAANLTLKEILKMIREISYDMVSYYDDDNKGIIYRDEKYSRINQEQACQLQRLLSTACDLFAQSVVEHREFDERYLEQWLHGGSLQREVERLKERVVALEAENHYLEERLGEK